MFQILEITSFFHFNVSRVIALRTSYEVSGYHNSCHSTSNYFGEIDGGVAKQRHNYRDYPKKRTYL